MNQMQSLGTALIRIILGIIMIAHGIQKFAIFTVPGVESMLEGLGVPLPGVFAVLLPLGEIVSGTLLVAGLFTRIAGGIAALIGLSALFTMHLPSGLFADDGGYELVLLIAAAGASLSLTGGGRYALDAALPLGRRERGVATAAA